MMTKAYYEFHKDTTDAIDDNNKWVKDLVCKKVDAASTPLTKWQTIPCYVGMLVLGILGFPIKFLSMTIFHLTNIAHEALDLYKEDFDKIMYYDYVKEREWTHDSLSRINKNIGEGHQQMFIQLGQQHANVTNTLGDYMECSMNHLGIQTLQGK